MTLNKIKIDPCISQTKPGSAKVFNPLCSLGACDICQAYNKDLELIKNNIGLELKLSLLDVLMDYGRLLAQQGEGPSIEVVNSINRIYDLSECIDLPAA